jgi:GINS complex subunit 4
MDISDILEDLNARHLERDPFAKNSDDYRAPNQHSGQTDLQALTRAWVNERGAIELLPYGLDYNPLIWV